MSKRYGEGGGVHEVLAFAMSFALSTSVLVGFLGRRGFYGCRLQKDFKVLDWKFRFLIYSSQLDTVSKIFLFKKKLYVLLLSRFAYPCS